ncbi:hypothetical protein [Roseomonas sp. KE2513]|uniref:hypothetical protein n=1 Tax=Roseomonas sp. KE2513 TaxID=2479202 RepID=UPI0018DEF52D|nr:hypothetical protein [Roseomonas sp. KE2513]
MSIPAKTANRFMDILQTVCASIGSPTRQDKIDDTGSNLFLPDRQPTEQVS